MRDEWNSHCYRIRVIETRCKKIEKDWTKDSEVGERKWMMERWGKEVAGSDNWLSAHLVMYTHVCTFVWQNLTKKMTAKDNTVVRK